jgi:beta-phosphoglucomutase-like phosphatase (HAD superfamily)
MKTAEKGSARRGAPGAIVTASPRDYDAVLFDLDGVLTRTASVHAAAWKKLFDTFLEARAAEMGEPFVPFDIDADYRRYVDAKPRYHGVPPSSQRGRSSCRRALRKTVPAGVLRGISPTT